MKTTLVLLSFILISPTIFGQTNYYVSTEVDDSSSGLNPANAWRTFTYAASSNSPVTAGDTVFIRSGDYGNEHVTIEKTGISESRVVLEGYQTDPGNLPDLDFSYGDTLNPEIMPMLDGGDRSSAGMAIGIGSSRFVTIANMQITNYETGVYSWSEASAGLMLDNIIVMSMGDINASYSGVGIGIAHSDSSTVRNCIVVNSSAEGISFVSDFNVCEYCRVYCDEDMTQEASTDYYIILAGNSNTVRHCSIERVGDLYHTGHGLGLKGDCEQNVIDSC